MNEVSIEKRSRPIGDGIDPQEYLFSVVTDINPLSLKTTKAIKAALKSVAIKQTRKHKRRVTRSEVAIRYIREGLERDGENILSKPPKPATND